MASRRTSQEEVEREQVDISPNKESMRPEQEHENKDVVVLVESPQEGEHENEEHVDPETLSVGSDLAHLKPSFSENIRDDILRWLDGAFFQSLGLVMLFLVIADGAFFFFLLMGWQAMCDTPHRTDCDPRNWWYNFSVQFLTVLFTYMVTVSMPWRCANFLHTVGWSCPHRPNHPGFDLYGQPSHDIWFHIPLKRRAGIEVMLLLNCLTQYLNQVTRGIFNDWDSQDTLPGVMWVNIFFGSSFLFAFIGLVWQIIEERKLRRQFPGKFPPGIIEWVDHQFRRFCVKKEEEEEEEAIEIQGEQEPELPEEEEEYEDPTRNPLHTVLLPCLTRANARLWGL